MSGSVAAASASPLAEWWRWLRRPAFWMPVADTFAVLTAASLPWSTSLVGIFSACWIGAAAMVVDYPAYFRSLKRPAYALPLALFALAAAGTLWSEASWNARLYAVGPTIKLLFLPGLFHHFERSRRGMWVLAAFGISCVLLMGFSWVVWFVPELKLTATMSDGVPVKNYIDQTQEFVLCVFVLAGLTRLLLERRRLLLAALCCALILGFFANLAFVAFARSALIYAPVMLLLFAARFLSARGSLLLLGIVTIAASAVWSTSPYLRQRVGDVSLEYQSYVDNNAGTSTGLRLEYWRKSLKFFAESPVLGNGTGSTRQLFERDAVGKTDVSADVIGNPHNQTLNVAVQWGLVGCLILFAMWFSHLSLFRGTDFISYVGLLVVLQNVTSSLFNSHIFDFHEGWMYVLGVGVAGGMVLGNRRQAQPGYAVRS